MFWKNNGILGINARNLLYIRPYNKKKAIKLADDKIKTKQFLAARDIPVPRLYSIIKSSQEIEKFDFNSLPNSFVLKPNKGYGGEGIIPIIGKRDNHFITAGNKQLSQTDLREHIRDIIDGRFSISNVADYAFFEQYIITDDKISKYSYEGLPDIRVVVHNLIPVMAMLRLPTKESQGKANLHMGAVGVGIDIAKGQCTHIAYKDRIIEELPDGLGKIRGLKIPQWDEILEIASRVQLITNLGYMAVDICLDRNSGPVLLEINARAGLGVQIANLAPLRRRLERIEGVKVTTPTKGVRIAKDMFGNVLEKEIASLSGKQVIGTSEDVEIIQKSGIFRLLAQVDTSREISTIDEETARKAGLLESSENYEPEKRSLKIKFTLKNKRIQTIVNLGEINGSKNYKMVLGKRDLKNFLIDTGSEKEKIEIPDKEVKSIEVEEKKKINFKKIDQELNRIDKSIKLLYHLRPLNLKEEQTKFFHNPEYNPQFEYHELKFDPMELVSELEKIQSDDSELGKIFAAKKKEISLKIELIESINENDFTRISRTLFGAPSASEVEEAEKIIQNIDIEKLKEKEEIYSAEDAKERFEKVFQKYGLKNWKVKIKNNMVADCVAGKNNRLFVKENARFSKERIESLIIHEIETHIITAENGKMQDYEIFNRGLANYLKTQEGMAMYNVEKQQNKPFSNNFRVHSHVIAIDQSTKGSFSEAVKHLKGLGVPQKEAFYSVLKAKRGFNDTSKPGAFTKDYIYFKGYHQVKEYIKNGGELSNLYMGKMDVSDAETVKKIPGIRLAKLLPSWLK